MRDLMHLPVWPFILILGYPALTIVVLEFARRLALRAPFVSGILRQVAYVQLPTGGIWLILRVLAELPADDWAVRAAETAFALTGLYLLLRVAQAFRESLEISRAGVAKGRQDLSNPPQATHIHAG